LSYGELLFVSAMDKKNHSVKLTSLFRFLETKYVNRDLIAVKRMMFCQNIRLREQIFQNVFSE
jgi:hypothetical protein